jgi:hypothetical protein
MIVQNRVDFPSMLLPCILGVLALIGRAGDLCAETFESRWQQMPDRLWIGPECWANPMEDWRIEQGRLECTTAGPGRNVHALTHQLAGKGAFTVSVRCGLAEGKTGSAGFELGIHDQIVDYRGNCFFGSGLPAFLTTDGRLKLADKIVKLDESPAWSDITLKLSATPAPAGYQLSLTALNTGDGVQLGQVSATVSAERLVGNIALTHNPRGGGQKPDALFWFNDWTIGGDQLDASPDRAFGPILWAMHTLSNSRSDEGYVMKMTALLPPIG